MRQKLIDATLDLASDEFEDNDSLIKLAKMSEEDLVDNLINIAEYYRDENNE
jgi:hypothetical protein